MKRGALQISKFFLSILLLLIAEITFIPNSSFGATSGSGACQQTYTLTGTGDITVYESGGYCYVAFRNTGAVDTQAIFTWTRPTQVTSVDALVVGGGGGGGARHGGGGGAGGFVQTDSYAISTATTIAIAVGGGGSASTSFTGTNGQNSYFKPTSGSTSGLIAIGGGGGANGTSGNGGSSGGAGSGQTVGSITAQTQSTFAGVTLTGINFGNLGAAGAYDTNAADDPNDYWAGGGGGGASSAGSNPLSNGSPTTAFATYSSSTAKGGTGGDGKSVSWLNATVASNLSVGQTSSGTVYFSGGGGGGIGVDGLSGGTGGLGGGANGTRTDASGNPGSAHTGGGGGGSGFDDINKAGSTQTVSAAPAGAGGSGVVVLRFTAPDIIAPTISSATYATTSGSDNVYGIGDTITVRITFSETVTVSGAPRIPVQGLTSKYAVYASGSGTTMVDFNYVVALGDADSDGVAFLGNSLDLNSGTIRDAALNDAVLTFTTIAAVTTSAVDGVIPTVTSIATSTNGVTVIISMSETPSSVALTASWFVVTVNGVNDVVKSAVQSGAKVNLTLTFGVVSGDTISLTYTDPTSANNVYALQDIAGNDVATFTMSVSNLSTAITNTSISLAVTPDTTTALYRLNNSIVATVSTAGKVDFKLQGKYLAGCRNVATTGSGPITATCTWKPSIHNSVTITATLKPSGAGFINSTASPLPIFVLKRTNSR